jgi:pimeloyl-ACP methyl ester carboxylesterase
MRCRPNPLRGLPDDSAYLAAFLKSVSRPIVLVGHSYGGAVITNAATGNAGVKALVYVVTRGSSPRRAARAEPAAGHHRHQLPRSLSAAAPRGR